jgi:arginyl-tRNA synthetase
MADKTEKHDPESIRQVNYYVDDAGRKVHEFIQMYGKKKDPKFYKGEALIVISHPLHGQQHVRLEFLLEEARSIQEAFRQFDEVAESEKNRWVKEETARAQEAAKEERGKVVGVKTMPKILGPGGKPV